MAFSMHGIGASKGIAIGRIHVVDRGRLDITERTIEASAISKEVERFRNAVVRAKAQLRAIRESIPDNTTADIAAFIDTHLLMLEDSALTSVPEGTIRDRGCNAEWALKLQRDAIVAVFDAMDDPYLRTRKDDVDHVVNRVQETLLHSDVPRARSDPPLAGRIVFADDLTPADTVLMQNHGVAAFVTEFGGPNSHTAILARSLGIPAVVGLHNALHYVRNDELVVVDARQGVILGDLDDLLLGHYRRRQRQIAKARSARVRLRRAPVVTGDGETIDLLANVELTEDVHAAREVGAGGIGLYRTEFLFMNRPLLPDEEEQYEAYVDVINGVRGKPVTIRTLDLGADKQVDGTKPGAPMSSNPALGLRAVRLCLKEQSLFRPQLRAILRASAHGPVRLMIPMISTLQELMQVLAIIREVRQELEHEGLRYDPSTPIGAMIEVPAAAVCADIFAKYLDFLSIGTNDLIQYTIAIDRIDDEVSYLYDPLHPAVLRLIQNTIRAGQRIGIPVAMCGEMAGDARFTRLLLGMGLKEFSVHPNALLEVKQAINESHAGESRKLANRLMRVTKSSTREALLDELNRSVQIPSAIRR